jgi:acyl-CoA synthetase
MIDASLARQVPAELEDLYLAGGEWTDDTLGSLSAAGLAAMPDAAFNVHSAVNPWRGTCGDVDRAARCLAANLAARGIGAGDIVLFQLPNWVEAAIGFYAAAYLGAIVVPVVHFYGPKEVAYIVEATSPAVVVTPDAFGYLDYLENYQSILADHDAGPSGSEPLWLVARAGDAPLPAGAMSFAEMIEGDPLADLPDTDPTSPSIIAFTSGTTRDPKGVVHSHRTICNEIRQLDYMFPHGGPPPITGAPVGHFIGMVNGFLMPLMRDRPVNLLDVWDPGEVLRLMVEENLGVAGGATFFITSLLDHPDFDERHLKQIPFSGLGGSSVPYAVMERLESMGIDAFRSYGSTEHPSVTGCLLSDPWEKRAHTDGRVLPGVEIQLTEDGEILSRGPDCFIGYVDRELTPTVFDDEGWYHTGDVGVLDDDGYLTITDRIADVIIRGGENLSAVEIEESMITLDAVAEVAVVAAPDERMGEHAAAIVRLHEGAEAPTLTEVREHLGSIGLAKQKWPESLHSVDEFPRTPSGKVQKFKLRQSIRDDELPAYD